MRLAGAIILMLLLPTTVRAAPWSNYELTIGDGYRVQKDMEDSISRDGQGCVLFPGDYRGVYPCIEEYSVNATHIFVQGRRTPVAGQVARKAFFILTKADGSVTGPLSGEEFDGHPIVRAAGALDWIEPRHPHPWRLFTLLFLGLFVPARLWQVASSPWFYVPLIVILMAVVLLAAFKMRRCEADGRV